MNDYYILLELKTRREVQGYNTTNEPFYEWLKGFFRREAKPIETIKEPSPAPCTTSPISRDHAVV